MYPPLERERPAALVPIDIKKLAKFNQIGQRFTSDRTEQSKPGWGHVHARIEDASRVAVMPEKAPCQPSSRLRLPITRTSAD